MHVFEIVRTVLLCLALGLFLGATAAIAARVFGVEPAPPGVVGALVGMLTAVMLVRQSREV
ncbi:MAG: hypothetical protein WCY15_11280 [Phenylobacterium sp.]|jgi:energy-converting hydrogenase Eha subunit A|uniref:hypothetical protein n=1 Tax=Phenylobacterium sp. TaxID=1871053 RepID=UPI002A2F6BE3|nr:hypothetical protein [Phenylobacterium sp.]MDD3837485.1 hypothetical protein [Phenylobacterium sp.]MDX9999446.1 hypothetical protein [Phenylobacterium sp.]